MALDKKQRDWLALTLLPGVGTTLFIRLLARFGTPTRVLGASEAELREVVGPKLAERIRHYRDQVDVEAQVRAMDQYGATALIMDDPAYPGRLAEIYDPPLALFMRGDLHEADQYSVAIVGTRKATAYGLRMAERLAGELAARGITVVSGLAAGVDTAAHRGALDAGGRSLAVLGCGVDVVYPAENAELMHRLTQEGAVLSPFPMGTKPSRGRFPQRNRVMSGLCLGTLVIEAPPGSGSLITAKAAAEQGREVFALPGQVGNRNSLGPHALIREGAKLVETVDDIVVELDLPVAARQAAPDHTPSPTPEPPVEVVTAALEQAPEAPAVEKKPRRRRAAAKKQEAPATEKAPEKPAPPPVQFNVSEVEKDVLSVLSPDGSFVDEIALACRISVSEALSSLTMLELKGLVRQFSGKRFAPR